MAFVIILGPVFFFGGATGTTSRLLVATARISGGCRPVGQVKVMPHTGNALHGATSLQGLALLGDIVLCVSHETQISLNHAEECLQESCDVSSSFSALPRKLATSRESCSFPHPFVWVALADAIEGCAAHCCAW